MKRLLDFYRAIFKISEFKVLKLITDFYIGSSNFNGITALKVCEGLVQEKSLSEDLTLIPSDILENYVRGDIYDQNSCSFKKLKKTIESLINKKLVTVVYDYNIHIKRYQDREIEDQINKLQDHFFEIGLYPSEKHLKTLNLNSFENLPYSRMLFMGAPQVEPLFFELKTLENYSRDPRFDFTLRDYSGYASIKGNFDVSDTVLDRDKTFIQSFGLGYKKSDLSRVVVMWITDLSNFTPEHQQRWNTHAINEECSIDPDYYKNQVIGEYADNFGIYSAFCEEFSVINKISIQLSGKKLFKDDFKNPPPGFWVPLSSTSHSFFDFAKLLDKMLSDNINLKFFEEYLDKEEQFENVINSQTGLTEVKPLGTLSLLEKYILKQYSTAGLQDKVTEIIKTFRKIRKLRSKDSHGILELSHDLKFDKMHDKLLNDSYRSLRMLRLILSNHPAVKSRIKEIVPDWLYEGRIRPMYFYNLEGIEY